MALEEIGSTHCDGATEGHVMTTWHAVTQYRSGVQKIAARATEAEARWRSRVSVAEHLARTLPMLDNEAAATWMRSGDALVVVSPPYVIGTYSVEPCAAKECSACVPIRQSADDVVEGR
jgi:hypothetical protein